jgi:transposase-like protein
MDKQISLSDKIGGEAANKIIKIRRYKLKCPLCSKPLKLKEPKGYRHPHGLMDDSGRRWHIYYTCDCGWDVGWHDVETRIQRKRKYGPGNKNLVEQVLNCLFEDGRMRVSDISRRTNIPISTVRDTIKRIEKGWKIMPVQREEQ